MSALDAKLRRDLRRSWPQNLAIALIVMAGVATLITFVGAHRSLEESRTAYYERQRFADVFSTLKRAPRSTVDRAARIPGVTLAEGRVRTAAMLDIEGMRETATAVLLSLPDNGVGRLNRIHLREGRMPEAARVPEAVVSDAFARAHGFRPGDTLRATFGGARRTLRIVGIALSPEFAYAIGPGDIVPDDRRFGVAWLREDALAAALDLRGAVNDIALDLARDASEGRAIRDLDALLAPYGGHGAHGRASQPSDAFLDSELAQLGGMASILPPIFLGVMAFLINMTLTRQVALERAEIGLLKAVGYGRWRVMSHYSKGVLVVVAVGCVLGFLLGDYLAAALARLYARYVHFPTLVPARSPLAFGGAALVAFLFALIGTGRAAWRAAALSPAEAMRPPSPPRYRQGWLTAVVVRALPPAALMIARNMMRFPVRAGTTTLGLAFSVGMLIGGLFGYDAIEVALDATFTRIERQDATVLLADPAGMGAVEEIRRWPGVIAAEPARSVPAILRHGTRSHNGAITAKDPEASLSRVVNADLDVIEVPPVGIALSAGLARKLGVAPGRSIEVEIRGGERSRHLVPVIATIEQFVGVGAYMHPDALADLLGQRPAAGALNVLLDPREEDAFNARGKDTPRVAAIAMLSRSMRKVRETIAESLSISIGFSTGFAALIAFGVAYNSARIGLSERARELASLRVLGFTRAEASTVILGELFVCALLSLPIGWLIGRGLAELIASRTSQEAFSFPMIVDPSTVALSGLVMGAAVALSGALMVRRIVGLDLIAVLKTRD